MSNKRVFYLLVACVGIMSLLVIAGTAYANVLLQKESHRLVELKLENRILEEQQTSLVQANRDITKYEDLEKIANAVVPKDKDQAKTVREIVAIAEEMGITLSSITFPASTLGQQPAPVKAPAADTEGGETATPAPKPATPPVTQVKPVEGISGVFNLEITMQQDSRHPVAYSRFIDFLKRLEQNRRTAQVSSITVQPQPSNRNLVTFNLVLNVYIKP